MNPTGRNPNQQNQDNVAFNNLITGFRTRFRNESSNDNPAYTFDQIMTMGSSMWANDTPQQPEQNMASVSKNISTICARCDTPKSELDKTAQKMQRCGGCKVMCYCSKECQTAHWPIHKSFCLQNRK